MLPWLCLLSFVSFEHNGDAMLAPQPRCNCCCAPSSSSSSSTRAPSHRRCCCFSSPSGPGTLFLPAPEQASGGNGHEPLGSRSGCRFRATSGVARNSRIGARNIPKGAQAFASSLTPGFGHHPHGEAADARETGGGASDPGVGWLSEVESDWCQLGATLM